MNNKVLYIHRRNDTNNVFYVGIGKPQRPYETKGRNYIWNTIINKTDYSIEILVENLDWDTACNMEINLIEQYGRIDLGTGTLSNMTSGGDGKPYCITTNTTKSKIINSLNDFYKSDGGMKLDEHISSNQVGHVVTSQSREKMSKTRLKFYKTPTGIAKAKRHSDRLKVPILQYSKTGEFIKEWKSGKDVLISLGIHISKCVNGHHKTAGGFVWKRT